MREMFNNCSSLSSLPDISKWNTNNVINMNYIFDNCILLLNITNLQKNNDKFSFDSYINYFNYDDIYLM